MSLSPEREVARAERREQDRGAFAAKKARTQVAAQLGELIEGSASTGSAPMVAARFRELAIAERSADPFLIRGAAMELAREAALFAVRVDLRQQRS